MRKNSIGTELQSETPSIAEALNQAEALIDSSRYPEAREKLQEISRNSQFPILSEESHRFHYLRGLLFFRLGEQPAAWEETKEALRIFNVINGSVSIPERENLPDFVKEKLQFLRDVETALLAGLQESDGTQILQKSKQLEERVIEISSALEKLDPLAKMHYLAGFIKLNLAKLDEAQEHFECAATGSLLSKDWAALAKALNGKAQVHFYKSDLGMAIQILEQATRYSSKAGDRHFEAILRSILVHHQLCLGLWRPALSVLPEVLAELQRSNDIPNYCGALLNWGHANLLKGRLKESERAFGKSLRMAAKHNLATYMKLAHAFGAQLCLETGKFEEAENRLKKALDIARRSERGGYTETLLLRMLGDALASQNRFEKARQAYAACQSSLANFPQKDEGGFASRGMAVVNARQGQNQAARRNFKKALEIFEACNAQLEKAKTFVIAAESGVFTEAEMEPDLAWAKEVFKRLEHPSWVKRARALLKKPKSSGQPVSLIVAREQTEREQIVKALLACNGNITQAAKKLGLLRQTLQYKTRHYGIEI